MCGRIEGGTAWVSSNENGRETRGKEGSWCKEGGRGRGKNLNRAGLGCRVSFYHIVTCSSFSQDRSFTFV